MTVFANGLEVSAETQGCKMIAAFPDVCFTPPQTPATPAGVPIPYPNFGMDSDLSSGSGTVKIGGKPVSQENSSHYKRISGDEAGAAPKKNVITSKNMGKAYAQMWSMNVKVDGKGVVRFGDIATSNHASNLGGTPPVAVKGSKDVSPLKDKTDCLGTINKDIEEKCDGKSVKEACQDAGLAGAPGIDPASDRFAEVREASSGRTSGQTVSELDGKALVLKSKGGKATTDRVAEGEYRLNRKIRDRWVSAQAHNCLAALRCRLVSYDEGSTSNEDQKKCCGKQTPHHLVPSSSFVEKKDGKKIKGCEGYDPKKAPCICVEGSSSTKGSHGMMHNLMKVEIVEATSIKDADGKFIPKKQDLPLPGDDSMQARSMTYSEMRDAAARHVCRLFKRSGCNEECIKQQLNDYHEDGANVKKDQDLRASLHSGRGYEEAKNRIAALDLTHAEIAARAPT